MESRDQIDLGKNFFTAQSTQQRIDAAEDNNSAFFGTSGRRSNTQRSVLRADSDQSSRGSHHLLNQQDNFRRIIQQPAIEERSELQDESKHADSFESSSSLSRNPTEFRRFEDS